MSFSTAPTANTPQAKASLACLVSADSLAVHQLTEKDRGEVVSFLAARPIHTMIMAGWIHDNGLVSPLNRGTFYACRNRAGQLEGVALIGEITLLETRSDAAVDAFASLAQDCANLYLVMGEKQKIERFWTHYTKSDQSMGLFCRELLYELQWPTNVLEEVPDLRLATLADLELVMSVHAEMAFEESGVNPLEVDPEGFQRRCARRIEQKRVWVWIDNGQLIFKADIISEIPEVVYLEGVYVNPAERAKGYGRRCLSQLSRSLLAHTKSVCLLVNEQNREAQSLYRTCNFKLRSCYDTIFLQHGN